ncbi:glycosyltransferase family 39 protein [Babjeviella inositovora NRRL Y-12698]|uniref:Dolichyl-phosphate-mannose--protein mannosyltransferase n=1 Tax=Babjeviella inositovora NRRL Y-12698 TaxID=984486 RepID=A0A1E3QUC7_9ASCO|nr:glycosyltransferase family 39 protein [Babjeviella inositovora NRRL Y-12698]ODQ81298.1 glycosyltransferase family 39 protein [Babjeviella inositovora NRRL Y-12698]
MASYVQKASGADVPSHPDEKAAIPAAPLDDDLNKTKAAAASKRQSQLLCIESYVGPLIITALAFAVRAYRIGVNNHVVWDEAHFGKFGSYYLRHEFYHDVHPPLAKMLVGFSGYLAGYNGSWDFPSGETYPDHIDYVKMRLFQVMWSAGCAPLAYLTMKDMGFSLLSVWLFSLMIVFELSYVTLGKMILLDSILLFFTVSVVFCLGRFHNENTKEPFTRKWFKWLGLLGLSIGCVCASKMVGLFVTSLVGIYTVVDLWNKFGDKQMSNVVYLKHWGARIVGLCIIPILVFMAAFKVHFDLLSHSGTGDATMSSLFQANLVGSSVGLDPREVTIGYSSITLKNQGLGGSLLHSHVQTYPEGSKQQQVTTYAHKDANNEWKFDFGRPAVAFTEGTNNVYVVDGMEVRLVHALTGKNLHTHDVKAPVSAFHKEVSCYGNDTIGDEKDNWIVEIVEQYGNEDKFRLHPLTTSFRMKSPSMGCYLAQSDKHLPSWGFNQGEVVCVKDPYRKDKRTWWNLETNVNANLPAPAADFKLPRTKFLKDFVHLNIAMMATNNALVPDSDKQDDLSSEWWQWPTLNTGIRLCSWANDSIKYYLIGSPATTWPSTVSLFVLAGMVIYYLLRWQRQYSDFVGAKAVNGLTLRDAPDNKLHLFVMGGIYPMLGWGLHFMPFVIMGRVKYVHHYMPALYFAMMVFVFVVEHFTRPLRLGKQSTAKQVALYGIFAFLYILVISVFWHFRDLTFGMEGDAKDFAHLNLLSSWTVIDKPY